MPQSTVCADTGNQATITFASGISASLKVRSIDPSEQSLGQLDASDLSTTGEKCLIPEDLSDPRELSVEWLWDTFDVPPVLGTNLGLVTITFPLRTGELTPATLAGTGYVAAVKYPQLANNELQVGTMRVQYDGETQAAYTKST